MPILDNIYVILVNPSGSMNIGMAARAMKNFDITHLRLVAPVEFKQNQAYMMAVGAKDIVDNAERFQKLSDALKDISCSVAFSRRMTKERAPFYSLDEISMKLAERAQNGRLGLVFGREADGLTREELYQCDFRTYIPTSASFGSLNLAQAVLIACQEIFKRSADSKITTENFFEDQRTVGPMLNDLEKLLFEIGYNRRGDTKLREKIIQAFKEICGRAGLRKKDVNMFLGIWSQIRKNLPKDQRCS